MFSLVLSTKISEYSHVSCNVLYVSSKFLLFVLENVLFDLIFYEVCGRKTNKLQSSFTFRKKMMFCLYAFIKL